MSKTNQTFLFELLCIDPSDIKQELSLAQALCFSNKLWNGHLPRIISEGTYTKIKNDYDGIEILIKRVDTSNALTTFFEIGFLISVISHEFDTIEPIRIKILKHLKNTLQFEHIRLLTDDTSTYVANQLYPEINKIENMLRRYLIKFFMQRVGFEWWETTANKQMIEKAKLRKSNKVDEISALIDDEVRYVDFDDLGELIYKQSSGYNNPDKIVQRLLNMKNNEDFKTLQNELQSNYTKYFKENFQDKQFEQKWKEIIKLRHKVAHQGIFYKNELIYGMEILNSLSEIIQNAEKHIDSVVFSLEDKEAILNANIESRAELGSKIGLKVLGKLDIPDFTDRPYSHFIDIEEDEMLREISSLQFNNVNNAKFIGLKWFVTEHLAIKGYNIASSFLLVNILIDKGKIKKYEITSGGGFPIVAIKLPKPSNKE